MDGFSDLSAGSFSRQEDATFRVSTQKLDSSGVTWHFCDAPVGRLYIAARDGAICEVSFEQDSALLQRGILDGHGSVAGPGSGGSDDLAVSVREALFGALDPFAVPVLVSGSEFELRVWRLLRRVPRGGVMSYGALASALGTPRAARAVGRAVGRNRLAGLVPCHRIVRSDGGPGGYRWGVDRKKRWLEMEGRLLSQ